MAPIAPEAVYTKTAKGILEIRNKTVKLAREVGLVFLSVDGQASVADLLSRSGMTAPQLHHALHTLVSDGYVKVVSNPAQQGTGSAGGMDLDFTSRQAMATVNMEAASRALAAADATKRAQQEARAAMEARLRQESEARARALAEARAESEAEERAKAEDLARTASDERARAELEASVAADPAARAQAEARARAAAAAAVRAEAEARVRAEAEGRARALAALKGEAEEEARQEAETRVKAEGQAQARAAAEARARALLEEQLKAMEGVRAHADNPHAQEADAARARVRELEAEAGRAREAAREIAAAEGRADEVPQPEMDIAERVRQLNVRVQAERRSREESGRHARDALDVEFEPSGAPQGGDEGWPSLQLWPGADPLVLRSDYAPARAIVPSSQPAESAQPAPVAASDMADLPVVDIDGTVTHPSPEHVPSPLERAMAQVAARAQAQSRTSAAPSAPPAAAPPTAEAILEPDAEAPQPLPDEAAEAQAQAAPAEKIVPTIDDVDPLTERLNVDRAAHDIMAESTAARRKAEAAHFSRDAADARKRRMEEEARRAAVAARARQRKRTLWTVGAVLVALPLIAIAWLQWAPLNGYVPAAQRSLSARLNQPVTISGLRYVILPTPRLILEGVGIGKEQGVRVKRVEAHVLPFAVLAGASSFDTVEAIGVDVDPSMLGTIPAWTGGRTAGAVHVGRLRLSELKLNIPGTDLGAFEGDVAFERNGTIKAAVFTGPNARLELTPRAEGLHVALEASDWRIPYGPPVVLSQLTLSGLVDPGQIAASQYTGKVAGGTVEGAMTVRWAGPISIQGEFKLENARVRDLARELTPNFSARGTLKASGRYSLQGTEWAALRTNPQVETNFSIVRGELTNIDLVRAIQAPSVGAMRGGRTPFEELSGVLQIAGGHVLFRQLQLASGALNANGTLDVGPGGQLNGRLTAELASRGSVVARSALNISGTVEDPQLKR